ncbi:helix-turn-helix domain-containing protein [Klebsiella pneumoniae]|uniref:helix-turn-helix domain-containing protein n=1 Tax=Klebsiella pneumoniae TaxID=573 RepID=UPI0040556F24
MHQEDRSTRYIANRLGVHFSTVARALKRFRETGGYSRRPGSGRPRVTTPQDDRYIRLNTRRSSI